MSVRVRFAPSPTGHVHIGNIRTAIFNWLFARHEGGQFLLRIEDTDRERSNQEAIDALLDVMGWLGLDYDEEPLYQSAQAAKHLAAAEQLVASGDAYKHAKGEGGEAVLMRIPWNAPELPFVARGETVEFPVHPDVPLRIDHTGVYYAAVSKKGKAVEDSGCLAGFRELQALDAEGRVVFELEPAIGAILAGEQTVEITAASLRFTRHLVGFTDRVKGLLQKPLDSMKDQVIVRSDGNPIFHLANVVDDITQGVTHIVRGDDHVENSYRHLFLFQLLGATAPTYAHLPMIVNDAGKPYSKRDGDAYVSDFRDKGYLPEALYNYLTLLGWSPGDDREKMTITELTEAFTLERVRSAPSQMDAKKLDHLNGLYIADMPAAEFVALAHANAPAADWLPATADAAFTQVAKMMQSRARTLLVAADWDYFFRREPLVYDQSNKGIRKGLNKAGTPELLRDLSARLATTEPWDEATIEATVHAATEARELGQGSMNLPIRVAVTGTNVGAGLYETMVLLGRELCRERLLAAATISEEWSQS